MSAEVKQAILEGGTALGIELGSTRIKAVLIGPSHTPIASGGHDWENRLEDGVWTYRLDDVWAGIQDAYAKLAAEVQAKYGLPLATVGSMGVSAMMHGYLPFDEAGKQLVPFRTWRNVITGQAAGLLTDAFSFNIPQRWSIAHLYQAALNGEDHLGSIAFLTTLAGYVHWQLTGQKVLGVGEASGMFPVDAATKNYSAPMMEKFDELMSEKGLGWKLAGILPAVLDAGEDAGSLTAAGARLLDPTGVLQPGFPLCPPEGDAGTGMVATNAITPRTGNVSAGTSIFAMIVLEKPLSQVYPEIDIVATPAGAPVAMVHCNNCTSDLDAWIKLFAQLLEAVGASVSKPALYDAVYHQALKGDADAGGLLAYNYFSGEHITGFEEGRPLFVRTPESRFSLANFARVLLFSAMGTLKTGMDILTEREKVAVDMLLGHGGLFKTEGVGQKLMAGALGVPMAVMESAGEGGAWGIALLAAYRKNRAAGQTLDDYLQKEVFAHNKSTRAEPDPKDTEGFAAFMKRYTGGLAIERAAVEHLE